MKVLHVVPSLDPASGGPSRSVPALCAAEVDAGAEVTLAAFAVDDPEPTTYQQATFKPVPGTRQGSTPAYVRGIHTLISAADVVHVHSLWNPVVSIAAAAARRAHRPYVISPRGMLQAVSLERKRWIKLLARRLLEQRTIDGAAGIHFLTDEERESSIDIGRVPVLVAPNGVSEPPVGMARGAFRKRHGIAADRPMVAFVGRLHWSKHLELQLAAMRALTARGRDAIWVLVGPDEGVWARLRPAISEHDLEQNVLWTGALPHAESLQALFDSDVAWITSRHEAHSMAMNEALILGTPLVMTTSVGFPDAAAAGAALEVSGDAESLADATARILDHPEVAEGLRSAGKAFARAELSWSAIAMKTIDFYRSIAGDVPHP